MSARRVRARLLGLAAVTAAAAPGAGAQGAGLAARVAAAGGPATFRYATRAGACGDGREFVALGDHMHVNGSYRSVGGGWSRQACTPGPARVTVAAGGGVEAVRVGGADARPADGARDLGAVGAAEAAGYLVALAGRTGGRAAERAVMAAALADSVEVWRPLLSLARAHADEGVARTAMHWLGATAPAAAVPVVAGVLADPAERRPVRDGAAVALAFAPDGAGVPSLVAAAAGGRAAGGDAWARDRAVFWLGNADDPRARSALRALAAADTAAESARAQAIFALGHLDRDAGNGAFLRGLYPRLASARLRERVLQSVAQGRDAAARRWLVDVAADADEPLGSRKQALFWAGQSADAPIADLLAADRRLTGAELRRHYTFVLSQRPEDAAVDRLIAIARDDRDREVRRQAIFWLGQSRNPQARRYLESLVAP